MSRTTTPGVVGDRVDDPQVPLREPGDGRLVEEVGGIREQQPDASAASVLVEHLAAAELQIELGLVEVALDEGHLQTRQLQ